MTDELARGVASISLDDLLFKGLDVNQKQDAEELLRTTPIEGRPDVYGLHSMEASARAVVIPLMLQMAKQARQLKAKDEEIQQLKQQPAGAKSGVCVCVCVCVFVCVCAFFSWHCQTGEQTNYVGKCSGCRCLLWTTTMVMEMNDEMNDEMNEMMR